MDQRQRGGPGSCQALIAPVAVRPER